MIHGLRLVRENISKKSILISLLFLVIGLRKHCRVFGDSMLPSLYPGDLLIYKPFNYKNCTLKEGYLIIVKHPRKKELLLVKRIFSIKPNGIELRGDNSSESIDSREFGLINYKQIKGIVEHVIPNRKRILSI